MVLALTVGGSVVVLVVVGLFVFGLRRRLIQRSGGTFDCSLRWDVPEEPDTCGKGWVYGVARYNGDRIEWFRVFSYAPRPRRVLERSAIEVAGRRLPRARRSWRCSPTPCPRLSAPGDPPGAGDERGRADRVPRLAGGGAARAASECGVARPLAGRRIAGDDGSGGPCAAACSFSRRGIYSRPLLIALTSSPLAVSPLNSQKNAPPRPWLLAQAILVPMVAGVS